MTIFQPPMCLLPKWVSVFWAILVCDITQDVAFCVIFFHSAFCVIACARTGLLFMCDSYCIWRLYHVLIIHQFVDSWVCPVFYPLLIMFLETSRVNFLCEYLFLLLSRSCLAVGLLGCILILRLAFEKAPVSHGSCIIYIPQYLLDRGRHLLTGSLAVCTACWAMSSCYWIVAVPWCSE